MPVPIRAPRAAQADIHDGRRLGKRASELRALHVAALRLAEDEVRFHVSSPGARSMMHLQRRAGVGPEIDAAGEAPSLERLWTRIVAATAKKLRPVGGVSRGACAFDARNATRPRELGIPVAARRARTRGRGRTSSETMNAPLPFAATAEHPLCDSRWPSRGGGAATCSCGCEGVQS